MVTVVRGPIGRARCLERVQRGAHGAVTDCMGVNLQSRRIDAPEIFVEYFLGVEWRVACVEFRF